MGAQSRASGHAAQALRAALADLLDPLPAEGDKHPRAPRRETPTPERLSAIADPVPAAVMVILVLDPRLAAASSVEDLRTNALGLRVILTVRRAELRRHAGEVALPGGRRDLRDEHLLATALRESEEELGLERTRLLPAGALAPAQTIATNYLVSPFVALLDQPRPAAAPRPLTADATQLACLGLRPSGEEVAQVLLPTLAQIAAGSGERELTRRSITFRTPVFALGEYLIWGLTYRVLADLIGRLRGGAGAQDR
jgi:8-oxo-dGTP pyrophosphatase MutT (NUDIX family)